MKLFADYHTHTAHSHGKGRVIDNVLAARAAGLEEVGIADHGPASLFGVGVSDSAKFASIRQEISRVQALVPDVRVLASVEANIISLDGCIDVPKVVARELDILQCGFHHMVSNAGLGAATILFVGNWLAKLSPAVRRRVRVENTKAIVEAVIANAIDVITHPGLQMPIDTRELARVCSRVGTALEINTSHRNVTADYVRAARKEGARFSIGSDAHSPERVGDLRQGLEVAEAAGLEAYDIINSLPER